MYIPKKEIKKTWDKIVKIINNWMKNKIRIIRYKQKLRCED